MGMRLDEKGANFKALLASRSIFFILLFTLLSSFFGYREPGYCKLSDRITKEYVKEVAKPRGLLMNCTGGAMMDDIQVVTLGFLSFDTLSVEAARKLYVEMAEELIDRINRNDKVRPYLHNYPFEIKNIELTISFEDVSRHILGDGHVAHMFIGKNNTLWYEAYDSKTEEFYTLHKESYREARKIIQTVKMDNLR